MFELIPNWISFCFQSWLSPAMAPIYDQMSLSATPALYSKVATGRRTKRYITSVMKCTILACADGIGLCRWLKIFYLRIILPSKVIFFKETIPVAK